MASSSERKKGIAGRRTATRRRVNLTRRHTAKKPPARAPRSNGERRIHGLTIPQIAHLMTHDSRGFYAYFNSLSPSEKLEVTYLDTSGALD